jgi:hypothetical protein
MFHLDDAVGCARNAMFLAVVLAISPARADEVGFRIHNPSVLPVATVARVCLPVPAGLLAGPAPSVALLGGKAVPVQARVVTRHPDGSIRRVMLSIPTELPPQGTIEGRYPAPVSAQAKPAAAPVAQAPASIVTDRWTVVPAMERIELRSRGGALLATLEPTGPEPGPAPATVQVLDCGPQFVWLRYDRAGDAWNRQCDVQIFRTGELHLTQRIQARRDGDHWTPDFGWKLSAPGARGTRLDGREARLLGRDPDSRFAAAGNADLLAAFTLTDGTPLCVANPLALRQNRGTFAAIFAANAVVVRSNRTEPVRDLETQGLMIQEGAWRFSELVLAPLGKAELAARLDAPVYAHADWQAYDAVYHTGAPLRVQHPVLRKCVERMVFAQDMQMKGDDLGSMPWSWAPRQPQRNYTSAVRLNHALYVWEDWFRGGDPRLRAVVYDWCRNYFDLGIYWGPDPKYYGACRRGNAWRKRPRQCVGTFNPRFDNTPIFVHKGWSNFWLM